MSTELKVAVAAGMAFLLGTCVLIGWTKTQEWASDAGPVGGIYANYQSEVWEQPQTSGEKQEAQPVAAPEARPTYTGTAPSISQQSPPSPEQAAGGWTSAPEVRTGSQGCTPGYVPCLPPAPDYDCAGGSGNGPLYTGTITVTGYDRYGLDADGDGIGCE